MTYKRKGRPTRYFSARLEHGRWKELSTGTGRKPLAENIADMWEELAVDHRAWDLLNRVSADEPTLSVGRLYDLWVETKYNPVEMRRLLNDRDVEPLVAKWHTAHSGDVAVDSAQHALAHVRALVTEGSPCPVSKVTTAWLSERLAAYVDPKNPKRPIKRNTRRKVHSSWSTFFQYVTDVHGLFPANPMDKVTRPRVQKPPIQFYEQDEIERIVAHQPTEVRRVLFSLLYGTAMELSVALGLLKLKVLEPEQTIIGAGTKAHTRNRPCVVDDWAWPAIQRYVSDLLPTAPLFPGISRYTASDWHRQTVKALGLPAYPLKNARHSWAVRNLRAGVALRLVQEQLGHETAKLTLDTYGVFASDGADRKAARKKVTDYEAKRRQK